MGRGPVGGGGRWLGQIWSPAGQIGEVAGGPGGEGDGHVAVNVSNWARLQPPLEQRQERDLARCRRRAEQVLAKTEPLRQGEDGAVVGAVPRRKEGAGHGGA